ncbi:hypothetical protein BIV25_10790 [Streptomyces sp. MUSC 14]|uniref:hypothetical protein n=1 Tax=Streptomyces sp. MUSC 14 TaxID=1354889 RepID=UPI0008F5D1F2|nr:hypothetical protein [Streptomyces sp. MUSC 14]OIJ98988.1 hypothetical protein BIV25_10790 [Streptomyces sp. MUSC 14]
MTGPGRYHLLLTTSGQPIQHGWWWSEATARRKFAGWKDEYSSISNAQVTLTDEETGMVLTTWPEEP